MMLLKRLNIINFFAKVNNNDTTGFVLKTTYGTYKLHLETKISDADKKSS